MGRILIDTDELLSLGDIYASAAGSLANMQSQLSSTLAGTRLNEADPGIRAARVVDRQRVLDGQLARIADEYRTDGREFIWLAGRVEAEEGAGALSPGDVALPFAWRSVAGAVGGFGLGASVVAGLVGLAVPEGILGHMREAGLSALEATRETVASGVEVSRSALDAGLGLVGQAANGFTQAAGWLGNQIRHLVESAWNGIWSALTSLWQGVIERLRELVTLTASWAAVAIDAVRQVGTWVVHSLLGVLSFVGDLALDTFMNLVVWNPQMRTVLLLVIAVTAITLDPTVRRDLPDILWLLANPRELFVVFGSPGGLTNLHDLFAKSDGKNIDLTPGGAYALREIHRDIDEIYNESPQDFVRRRQQYIDQQGMPRPDLQGRPFDWRSNGCTGVADDGFGFDFTAACQKHDFLYGNDLDRSAHPEIPDQRWEAWSRERRAEIDARFRHDMESICMTGPAWAQGQCLTRAHLYYLGVRTMGPIQDLVK